MARFTARIELILPQQGDYNILHDEMEHEGFTRTIIGDDGDEYHLPDAEYNKIGEFNKSDIMAAAKRAANNTARHFRILITEEIGGRSWYKKLVALNKKSTEAGLKIYTSSYELY